MKNRVRQLREAAGLTQDALAEQTKVTRQTINSIERERYTASLPLAIRIARTFHVPVEEVFSLDDDHAEATEPAAAS